MIFELFLTFLKIGAFTFGGGYAMIPIIQKEIVDKRQWISHDDLLDIIAIAESTPGPIAINSATFVGYKVSGKRGAVVATLGVVLPSFLIIALVSWIYEIFRDLEVVSKAFWGIRVGVLALIVKAIYSMFKQCPKNLLLPIIGIAAFVAVAVFGVSVLFVIIAAAALGLLYSEIKVRRAKK